MRDIVDAVKLCCEEEGLYGVYDVVTIDRLISKPPEQWKVVCPSGEMATYDPEVR
jgi:hypothetical protein